jgi:hypothetical protein
MREAQRIFGILNSGGMSKALHLAGRSTVRGVGRVDIGGVAVIDIIGVVVVVVGAVALFRLLHLFLDVFRRPVHFHLAPHSLQLVSNMAEY